MDNKERRERIIKLLREGKKPISGSEFARKLKVSRQVIVQDIALLRAEKMGILATSKGYMLYGEEDFLAKRVVKVNHSSEEILDELQTIVDLGGKVLDVIVEHDIYGQIQCDMMLENRKDVDEFMKKINKSKATPLMKLSRGSHYHTIGAKSEEILDEIESKLNEKNYIE